MNNDRKPKVSVVMSVYNGEKYLREAIDSILNQTFTDFEFIIIDDGSTDKSGEIIKSYKDERIRLIQQKNQGLMSALDMGINLAKGEFIARMDADDISNIDRFRLQIDYMDKHKECVALGTDTIVIDDEGNKIYLNENNLTQEELQRQLPENNPFCHGSMLIRKNPLIECGGYRDDIPFWDDDFVWIDLRKYGEMNILSDPLYIYRITPNAMSNSSKRLKKKIREIRIKYFDTGNVSKNDILAVERIRSAISENDINKRSYYHFRVGNAYLHHSNRHMARKHLLKSVRGRILDVRGYFNLLLSFCPDWVISRWQRFRTN